MNLKNTPEIYRHTRRPDGLTVGEAMDHDAAELRSLGIDAQDGTPTFTEKMEAIQEAAWAAMLEAFDVAFPDCKPADADLPDLFAGIANYVERVQTKRLL